MLILQDVSLISSSKSWFHLQVVSVNRTVFMAINEGVCPASLNDGRRQSPLGLIRSK